jgi:uncharacterized protein with FMN-binding domain
LLVAAALTVLGAAIMTGHPPWGAVTAVSILLTAAAMAAGALAGKASPEGQISEPRTSSQKIPASLVTLSATAILAVYAAGYQRTRDAADAFEAQTARHQPAVAVAELPTPLPQAIAPATASQTPAVPQRTTLGAEQLPAVTPTAPQAASAEPLAANITPPATAANEQAAAAPTAPAAAKTQLSYKDGTFSGWGRCRHGSIQASVTLEGGQIVATEITQCLTRYSCSWISNLPGQVITRQSADVDYVSGATESTDAFYDAVASALASARE